MIEIETLDEKEKSYIKEEIYKQIIGAIKLLVDEIIDENEILEHIRNTLRKQHIVIKNIDIEENVIKRKRGLEIKEIRIRVICHYLREFTIVITYEAVGTRKTYWIKEWGSSLII